MTNGERRGMRTVLLVEDNAGDATLVREALQARAPEIRQIEGFWLEVVRLPKE